VPLLAAWRKGGVERNRAATRLFYGVLGLVSIWITLLPVFPSVTEAVMRRFHLTSGHYLIWWPQQVVPAMYSFANRYRLSTDDVPADADDAFSGAFWVNHYPPRLFTFNRRIGLGAGSYFLYGRSDYRGRRLITKMRVDRDGEGGFRMFLEEERYSAGSE